MLNSLTLPFKITLYKMFQLNICISSIIDTNIMFEFMILDVSTMIKLEIIYFEDKETVY